MAWFSPRPLLIPDILALNAEFLAEKPAVVADGEVASWTDFGNGTARVANALAESGLAKGDRVAVLMNNSYEMAEAMFGVIRGGFVAVPLNVSITDDAVAGMIENCDARAVIASDAHVMRIENMRARLENRFGERLVAAGAGPGGWRDYPAWRDAAASDMPDVQLSPADECNIIYSSGTTGLPKGIVHDHACREAWGSDMAVALRYHSGARALCTLGLFSNISWVSILATFFAGGTIVVGRRFDPADCLETIERERITHAAMVPLQFQKLLACDEFSRRDLSSLDASMCCGSPLSAEWKKRMDTHWPGQFIELYGLTEGLVTILGPEDLPTKPHTVGRPCPGQRLAIIDDDGRELPAGQPGEIVGHCRFLMAGYHANDAASEEATWLHPDGDRWLRTGDIGQLDEDGFLTLVDRKKDMIISGGQNIYPADIEAVIAEHGDVREVAVIGATSRKWGETPLAVVVPDAEATTPPEELTAWANGKLGKQQRIASCVFVDELPRNPNGKILKRVLREQFADLSF